MPAAGLQRGGDLQIDPLYAAESVPSATGAIASSRLIADATRMAALAEALANKLAIDGAAAQDLVPAEQRWIESIARACGAARERTLVTSGAFADAGTDI